MQELHLYSTIVCVCVVQSQEIYIHIQTNQFRSQTIETTTTYQNQNNIIYQILFKHFL